MRNRIFQRKSVSVKVTIIIFILVFPLNLLAIYQNQIATDTMLKQGEMALKNMADIQMKELEGRAEDLQFLLSYFNLQDADCIRMIQQPEDEFQYKSAMYRFYHTLKTMAGMMGSGDGYYYFMHQKEDVLYYNLNHNGGFDRSMNEFIRKNGRSPDYVGWNFVELPTGRYYVLVRNMKDISYGGWINLNDIEKKVLEELGSEEYQVLFSKNQIEKNSKRWVEAEAVQHGLRLSISVEKETLLGSLSRFQSLNRAISFFYLALIPILYLILRRMLFIPYSQAEQDLMELKLESYEYELSRQKSELENLQLQIRPHFLQNTFNLIFSLAQKNEISEVQGTILYHPIIFAIFSEVQKRLSCFRKNGS